jgi:hypothetical protein
MTDDEKREIHGQATVEKRRSQPLSHDNDDIVEKPQKDVNQGSDPLATRPNQDTAQAVHLNPPDDVLLTDRERALLEAIAEEFCERDETIQDLKREVAELRRLSDAQLRSKIEPLFQDFYRKLDATTVQVHELMRSINRREPLDLPPLPLARRVN